jgi:hypothetical protein
MVYYSAGSVHSISEVHAFSFEPGKGSWSRMLALLPNMAENEEDRLS